MSDAYSKTYPGNWQAVYARTCELEAEVERLRDALNKIHERDPYASLAGVIAWQIAGRALASDMGRSENITVVLASQLLGDLAELEELIGVRFSFRQETDEQARRNIKMHGLDPSNERLVSMLRDFSEGRCLMRGLDGRVAAVRFDVVDPAFLRAADTNPNKVADFLEQADT